MTDPDTITLKNGKELRKWTIFLGTVLLAIITAVAYGVSLQKQVEANSDTINRECMLMKSHFTEISTAGTNISRQNQRDIIGMKKDLQYIAVTVSKVADRVGVVQ